MIVLGTYFYPSSSRHIKCRVEVREDALYFYDEYEALILTMQTDKVTVDSPLPGLPSELNLEDNSRFIPDDSDFRWPFVRGSFSFAEKLEKNRKLIILSLIMIPIILFFTIFKGIPEAAEYSVRHIPQNVIEVSSEQSFEVISFGYLNKTELGRKKQTELQREWRALLASLDLDPAIYRLSIHNSPALGANAFALPNGRIIVTDDLIEMLEGKPHTLRAILLHEIGHVEYQHGMKLLARSAATSMVLAFLFGDLELGAEILLGGGSTLLEQSFSRDMETQADQFAIEKLTQLGYSSHDFAEAMEAFQEMEGGEEEGESKWLNYLSSHPRTQERIEKARNYTP